MNKNTNNLILPTADNIKRTPMYVGAKSEELFCWYHEPVSTNRLDAVVVICPSISLEYMNSYRTLRYTADYFAASGIPALRIDYLGTGSSAKDKNNRSVIDSKIYSINLAREVASKLSGCNNVILLGFRLGALFAALAAEKKYNESVIFWAGIFNGRKYVRELKALQMTASIDYIQSDKYEIDTAGTLFTTEQTDELSQLNLINRDINYRNILLLNRDDFNKDKKQISFWKKSITVNEINSINFSGIVCDAHETTVPFDTISELVEYTMHEVSHVSIKNDEFDEYTSEISIIEDEALIIEKFVQFGINKSNFGIISEPSKINHELPIIIISNSGANHQVGPNDLYLTIARKLSAIGFICLRFDVHGIGDSLIYGEEDHNVYPENSELQIKSCQSFLAEQYNSKKYILTGLCSGAYMSFNAAHKIDNNSIVESILINPLTYHWEPGMILSDSPVASYQAWSWYKQALFNRESWLKLISGKISYKNLLISLKNRLIDLYNSVRVNFINNSDESDINSLYSKLNTICYKNKVKLTFLFSDTDPGLDMLMLNAGKLVKKLIRTQLVSIITISNANHTFSRYAPRAEAVDKLIYHIRSNYLNLDTKK